jgi:Methyltransferase domain
MRPGELIQGLYLVPALLFLDRIGVLNQLRTKRAIPLSELVVPDVDSLLFRSIIRYFKAKELLNEADGQLLVTVEGLELFNLADLALLHGSYLDGICWMGARAPLGPMPERDFEYDVKASSRLSLRHGTFAKVADFVATCNASLLIDLGCGDGAFLIEVSCKQKALQSVGVDASPVAVRLAETKVERARLDERIKVIVGDLREPEMWLREIPDSGKVCVTATFVMHELTSSPENVSRLFLALGSRFREYTLILTELYSTNPVQLREYRGSHLPEFFFLHELTNQKLLSEQEWGSVLTENGHLRVGSLSLLGQTGGHAVVGTTVWHRQ